MENRRLIETEKLQKVMTEIVEVFKKNELNTLEITFVISELLRLNEGYQLTQKKKIK